MKLSLSIMPFIVFIHVIKTPTGTKPMVSFNEPNVMRRTRMFHERCATRAFWNEALVPKLPFCVSGFGIIIRRPLLSLQVWNIYVRIYARLWFHALDNFTINDAEVLALLMYHDKNTRYDTALSCLLVTGPLWRRSAGATDVSWQKHQKWHCTQLHIIPPLLI